jgi:hypothetical protein
MDEACARRDLVKNPAAMPLLWGLPIGAILVTGHFAREGWVVTAGWTLSLLIMGSACLVNARGCGRRHCYFTGVSQRPTPWSRTAAGNQAHPRLAPTTLIASQYTAMPLMATAPAGMNARR